MVFVGNSGHVVGDILLVEAVCARMTLRSGTTETCKLSHVGVLQIVDIGDMVIMSQDTSNNWIYNIIPSGDDTDVYYTPSNDATNHQVKFTDNAGTLTVAHKIIGTNGITTTASVNGKTLTETIKHIAITPTSATAAVTNNFVSAMTFDDYGHPKTVTYAPAHVAVTPTASSSTVTTFINGLTFDTYGHVTAYTSATVNIDTNMYWHTLS